MKNIGALTAVVDPELPNDILHMKCYVLPPNTSKVSSNQPDVNSNNKRSHVRLFIESITFSKHVYSHILQKKIALKMSNTE